MANVIANTLAEQAQEQADKQQRPAYIVQEAGYENDPIIVYQVYPGDTLIGVVYPSRTSFGR